MIRSKPDRSIKEMFRYLQKLGWKLIGSAGSQVFFASPIGQRGIVLTTPTGFNPPSWISARWAMGKFASDGSLQAGTHGNTLRELKAALAVTSNA